MTEPNVFLTGPVYVIFIIACIWLCILYILVPKGVQEKRTEVLENKVDRMWVINASFEWTHVKSSTSEGRRQCCSSFLRNLTSVWFVTRCWTLHITTSPHHCAANHAVNCEKHNWSYKMWSTWVLHYEAGTVQWLEHRTRDWKVAGLNPCRSGGRIFFSRVNFLCWLIFRYPFHPRVTAVVRKRPRSLRQKWRWHWQVTAKHACYYYYYWSLLYSAILRSWADSLRLHVILHEWIAFYGTFLNIHRSGVLTALALHMNTPYVCGFAWSDSCSCSCMVVWCTENVLRWQQFHVAPAIPAL